MRATALIFAVKRLSAVMTETAVPGLHFISDFIDKEAQRRLEASAYQLHHKITHSEDSTLFAGKTHLSKYHNLSSSEYYRLVTFEEAGAKINAQYFAHYGEDGHKLTYFIGSDNIPGFVKTGLAAPMEELTAVEALKTEKAFYPSASQSHPYVLQWNLTFNVYSPAKTTPHRVAGFPFHVDIKSNGDITAIYTLLSAATLEIRKKGTSETPHAFTLTPGSLLLLSQEARWDWEHRVTPTEIASSKLDDTLTDSISRMSLVLGCS